MSRHVNARVSTEFLPHDNKKGKYLLETLLATARSKEKLKQAK